MTRLLSSPLNFRKNTLIFIGSEWRHRSACVPVQSELAGQSSRHPPSGPRRRRRPALLDYLGASTPLPSSCFRSENGRLNSTREIPFPPKSPLLDVWRTCGSPLSHSPAFRPTVARLPAASAGKRCTIVVHLFAFLSDSLLLYSRPASLASITRSSFVALQRPSPANTFPTPPPLAPLATRNARYLKNWYQGVG